MVPVLCELPPVKNDNHEEEVGVDACEEEEEEEKGAEDVWVDSSASMISSKVPGATLDTYWRCTDLGIWDSDVSMNVHLCVRSHARGCVNSFLRAFMHTCVHAHQHVYMQASVCV